MIKLFCTLILLTNSLWAMPKKLEVWFLSTESSRATTYLESKPKNLGLVSERALQCQPMGDYCFDPQIGLYKKDNKIIKDQSDYTVVDKNEKYEDFDEGDAVQRNMINCDKSNLFDLYCGKAKAKKKKSSTKLTFWIDVSSTMKQVDFPGFNKRCMRESLIRRLNNKSCGFSEEMKVYVFNESKKELGMMDRVCLNSGLNSTKRIIRDIKANNASHLVIITDIFEASQEFVDFIEGTGVGVVKGLDKPIYAPDLLSEVDRLNKVCR